MRDFKRTRIISRHRPVRLHIAVPFYMKWLVYADEPETIETLEENIRGVMAIIGSDCSKKVLKIGLFAGNLFEVAAALAGTNF